MNSREGVDLAKMSISVLLLVLLIGAIMGMFYYMSDEGYRAQKSVEDAVKSGEYDNLFDLTDYTRDGATVPVPTVVSALTEFDDEDIVYIRICHIGTDGNPDLDEVYAPRDCPYTFKDSDGAELSLVDNDTLRFVNTACRRLLQYSEQYCTVTVDKVSATNATGVTVTNIADTGLYGASIVISESR